MFSFFGHYIFFAWHHTESGSCLHQTPLDLQVLPSESSLAEFREYTRMQTMHLESLSPWQQSCYKHTARTGTRAIALHILYVQASAMQQQIVFVQTTYLKNKPGITYSPFSVGFFTAIRFHHMQDSNSQYDYFERHNSSKPPSMSLSAKLSSLVNAVLKSRSIWHAISSLPFFYHLPLLRRHLVLQVFKFL